MDLLARLGSAAALLAIMLVVEVAGVGAAPDGPPLFREPARPPATPLPASPRLLRSRYVDVEFAALGGVDATVATAPATVLLNLFPDATFTAERDSVEAPSGGGLVWTGHLAGVPGSSATLVVTEGVLAGTIFGGGQSYSISYSGEGLYVINEVNQAAFPPD